MRLWLAIFAVIPALCSVPATAFAFDGAAAICENRDGSGLAAERRVEACTSLLQSGAPGLSQEANMRINRAWAYGQQRNWAAARADYDKAIALDPLSTIAFNERALLFLRTGRLSDALRDYEQALRLQPGAPYSLYGRGLTHLRQGHKDKGAADLAMARRLSSDIDAVFAKIGLAP